MPRKSRMYNSAQVEARQKELDKLAYMWEERSALHKAEDEAARIIEEQVKAEIGRKHENMMASIYRELNNGHSKSIIAEAMHMSRQTLDYWIKRDGGRSSASKESIEAIEAVRAIKPARFTASDYKFANGGTNVDVLIHDNEGEYEDMRLVPSRNGEGYDWGYRHTSYQWPNKERIPKEVMDLMPQDEFWAFQQCTDEASKRIWLSWTKDERVLATVGKKPTVDEGLAAAEAEVDWA